MHPTKQPGGDKQSARPELPPPKNLRPAKTGHALLTPATQHPAAKGRRAESPPRTNHPKKCETSKNRARPQPDSPPSEKTRPATTEPPPQTRQPALQTERALQKHPPAAGCSLEA